MPDHPDSRGSSLRVGLIGFGGAGRAVGESIVGGELPGAALSGVLVRRPEAYASDPSLRGVPVSDRLTDLLATGCEVVVEAAGHAALREYGRDVLCAGRTLVTISVGALADDALLADLSAAAVTGNARLLVPSGAIAGLDAIESAALAGLETVTHTVRKPPAALLEPTEAAAVTAGGTARVLFEGPAREATRRFPENVNVVAAVSLAGLGLDRTRARVVADPAVSRNVHEVEASGAFGTVSIRVQNIPGPNPRTGRIVGPSVIRTLRRLRADVLIGA